MKNTKLCFDNFSNFGSGNQAKFRNRRAENDSKLKKRTDLKFHEISLEILRLLLNESVHDVFGSSQSLVRFIRSSHNLS